jgi:ABC-type transport system involved in cytochrome c biogenesis ATPase subunit/GNAT superfamily N-acetyltransferase
MPTTKKRKPAVLRTISHRKARPPEVIASATADQRCRPGTTFRVKSTSGNGVYKHMTVANEAGRETGIKVHRTAMVGPDDTIHIDPSNGSRIFVRSTEDPRDLIPVSPHYESHERLRLGSIEYEILVKEITTQSDLDEHNYLEGFHYKTSSAIVTDDSDQDKKGAVGGRKAILLAYIKVGSRLMPAGYVELQMPLLMCKPRHVLFAAGFHHPERDIAWNDWDVPSMRRFVNLIVRIARVVTTPDLRGLGLARTLIGTAKDFAKQRWQVGGRRPLFMEISAEMLKYMDFATSAGLHFVGNTEGNLSRIHADLVDMSKGQKISFGIMTLQKKYLTQLRTLSEVLGRPFQEVLDRLKEITANSGGDSLRSQFDTLQAQEWFLFKKVLRFPIPYYMCGLDTYSEEFVSTHAAPPPARLEPLAARTRSARIDLKDIRVTSTYEIPDSAQARAVRDCFGLDGSTFKVTLVGPVSIEASGGNIILITGPSGSGKSVLLRVLDPRHKDDMLEVSYRNAGNKPYEVAWLADIHSDKPLIEFFSDRWGMETSISALNQVGLSEAFIYLRPYRLLSRGQQYRARLAALSLGTESVWLMDEFCADLDPFTARIVASNLRKHVIRTGRVAIVAAANNGHYIDALRPTHVIYLRYSGKTEVLKYKEYVDEFCGAAK